MTPSPRVTWPSPAMTTAPLRRTQRTVVERIRRFVGMSAILDYSSVAGGALPASLLQSDQGHRQQRGKDADRFPAGEMFMEDHASQQNGDDRIKRTEHHGGIQPPGLFCADEERGSGNVQAYDEEGARA